MLILCQFCEEVPTICMVILRGGFHNIKGLHGRRIRFIWLALRIY